MRTKLSVRNQGRKYDVVVVGSGPNGLAAAITMAQAGYSVLIREKSKVAGGGLRSDELTLAGYLHDVCSAAHPMAAASPFFRELPLEKHGLQWIHSPVPFAHPLDDGVITQRRSIEETAELLGVDGAAYIALMKPLVDQWENLFEDALGPLVHVPKHPLLLARFGVHGLLPATTLLKFKFKTEKPRALLGGVAAHTNLPLTYTSSAAVGLVLATAGHAVGWPIARGGSGKIAEALIDYFKSLGGEIETDAPVESLNDLPEREFTFLDVTPKQALKIVGDRFPKMFRRKLSRFRYGSGVFKMDWALSAPVPWTSSDCKLAATVHVGGTLEQMVLSEAAPIMGKTPEQPYVLVVQPSLFDPSRAPAGKHTLWAYCHVPHGSVEDMSERIENQIERFAPGFKSTVLARSTLNTAEFEARNPNLVGGDISGGAVDFFQLVFRPTSPFSPYSTPDPSIFFCSSSTPPGPGVHGMCGWRAAQAALKK
jgi:phytoene dehydrogenase-like protein